MPRHQVLPYLNLDGEGSPDEAVCATVEDAFRALDHAHGWSHEDATWSTAYSPRYFDRSDDPLPDSVDLPEPRALSPFETPDFDRQDTFVHPVSNRVDAVLETERALPGEAGGASDVAVDANLSSVFSVASRWTSFAEAGPPAGHQSDLNGIPDGNPVPEVSPLFAGFKAGFTKNQATEGHVTVDDGPFAGTTTKHVADVRQRPSDWYGEEDRYYRVIRLFSSEHTEQGLVEGIGDSLGDDSDIDAMLDSLYDDAFESGRVGHVQKATRANRDDEGSVRLFREHSELGDDDMVSLHFPLLQHDISAFGEVHEVINGTDLTDVPTIRQRINNGILEYIFVRRHGNFLVLPRGIHTLPTPIGEVPRLND